jgi:hypothetical protein
VNRKIALIVDNAPTHCVPNADAVDEHGMTVYYLSNIKVIFLPHNFTSIVQSCDQGVIACAKAHYRRRLGRWMLEEAEKRPDACLKDLTPKFYQTMQWVVNAWGEDVNAQTICNCWRKAGLLPGQASTPAASVMDAEMLDEPDPVALEDGHHGDDQGLTGTLEESDFMASLESELSSLGLVADRMGWLKWAGCEEIVSASDFVNLSGEGEVFAEFNVEEIVELVLTEGQDKPDSDEDKHDEPHIVKEYAWKLQEFVEYHPDTFPPHLVSAVNDIRGKLNAMQLTGLRQASIIHLFQA